ncbi:MAG: YdcF family protein [Candidatus Saccharibacteria bacterium]|nr:YdcF family protein [Candidatus Saccharibacteria bacterium]
MILPDNHQPTLRPDMMVLGGATHSDGTLAEPSIRRAEHAAAIYPALCKQLGREAVLLVSGGYAVLAEGVASEGVEPIAPQMIDIIAGKGVPREVILCEATSISTIENFTNSIKQGLLRPEDYSPERPLPLLTDPTHMARARWMADILGLHTTPESPLYPIPPRERVVQGALTAAYGALTLDLWLKRRRLSEEQAIEQLEGRESLLGSCVGALRKCLPRTKATS